MQIRFPVFILIHNLFVDQIVVIMRIRFPHPNPQLLCGSNYGYYSNSFPSSTFLPMPWPVVRPTIETTLLSDHESIRLHP